MRITANSSYMGRLPLKMLEYMQHSLSASLYNTCIHFKVLGSRKAGLDIITFAMQYNCCTNYKLCHIQFASV